MSKNSHKITVHKKQFIDQAMGWKYRYGTFRTLNGISSSLLVENPLIAQREILPTPVYKYVRTQKKTLRIY